MGNYIGSFILDFAAECGIQHTFQPKQLYSMVRAARLSGLITFLQTYPTLKQNRFDPGVITYLFIKIGPKTPLFLDILTKNLPSVLEYYKDQSLFNIIEDNIYAAKQPQLWTIQTKT